MKQRGFFVGLFLLLFVLLVSLASAASSPVEQLKSLITGSSNVLTTFAEAVLGPGPTGTIGDTSVSYLFARVLFLIIVFVVVWAVIGKIPLFSEQPWIRYVLAGAVGILSTRFLLESDWVGTILLPYSAFGIAVTAFLPFVLWFFFVENGIKSSLMRKLAWIFAGLVFVMLWYTRIGEIANAGYIYIPFAILSLLAWWFDKPIQRTKDKIKGQKRNSRDYLIMEAEFMKELKHLRELLATTTDPAQAEAIKEKIEAKKKILKQVRDDMSE